MPRLRVTSKQWWENSDKVPGPGMTIPKKGGLGLVHSAAVLYGGADLGHFGLLSSFLALQPNIAYQAV